MIVYPCVWNMETTTTTTTTEPHRTLTNDGGIYAHSKPRTRTQSILFHSIQQRKKMCEKHTRCIYCCGRIGIGFFGSWALGFLGSWALWLFGSLALWPSAALGMCVKSVGWALCIPQPRVLCRCGTHNTPNLHQRSSCVPVVVACPCCCCCCCCCRCCRRCRRWAPYTHFSPI